jgi:thioredoxin-like negative regulator of GroEL
MFRPTFEGTLAEMGKSAQIVDVDQQRELAAKHMVTSVPTVLLVDSNGNAIKRNSGVMSKPQLKQFLSGI